MAQITIGRVVPNFREQWSTNITYDKLDVVYYNGSSYVAKGVNVGVKPDTPSGPWTIIAAKGSWASFTEEEKRELIEDIQHELDSISITEGTNNYNDF